MKRYRNFIVVTLLLSVVALYFLLNERKGTLRIDSNYFALTDTANISKITIKSLTDTLLLERVGDNWIVNKKFNAKVKLIKALLGALQSLEVQSPAPKSLRNEIQKGFEAHSINLTFESNTKILKEFEICDIENITLGTFIKEPNRNDFYIVRVPGFNNRLSLLFSGKESVWREKVVFQYKPWEILKISVEYPKQTENSFKIDLSNPDKVVLTDYKKTKTQIVKKEEIVRYILNYSFVPYEFMTEVRKGLYDSLKRSKPTCTISVVNIANQLNRVSVYTIPDSRDAKKINLFKMYAVLQNDTLPVLLKYTYFDPVMRKYQEVLSK